MSTAAERGANGVDQVFLPVAHDGFEGDGDADAVELFREVERVGVLAERGEHLGADGDDFGFHKGRFQLSSYQASSSIDRKDVVHRLTTRNAVKHSALAKLTS